MGKDLKKLPAFVL